MNYLDNNFVPDISSTSYKIKKTFTINEIKDLLQTLPKNQNIEITDFNYDFLHQIFQNKLPKRDLPTGNANEDAELLIQTMIESRYRRGPVSYLPYSELKKIILKHMSVKKDYMQIWKFIHKKALKIILPAFANKSFNPLKCTRTSPDLAEVWSLLHLHYMCKDLSAVYWAPVTLDIITDWIVYAPIFNEPIETVALYKKQLELLIEKLWCNTLSITDMSDIIKNSNDFNIVHHQKIEELQANRSKYQDMPNVKNLIKNTKNNLNLTMFSIEDLIEALVYEINWELSFFIEELANNSAFQYQAFVGTLYTQQVLKITYPDAIRATCHPKSWQWWVHLVWKESYNYPYNWVAYRDWKKVQVVNEIDMLLNNNIIWVYLTWEDKPFFYTKQWTDIKQLYSQGK